MRNVSWLSSRPSESSVFPLPTEILFFPCAWPAPTAPMRYALIAGSCSVLGGVLGWMIGFYAFDLLARPVLEFYGGMEEFELLKAQTGTGAVLLMLITSGVAHLPPMKVVTILSGAIGFSLPSSFWPPSSPASPSSCCSAMRCKPGAPLSQT